MDMMKRDNYNHLVQFQTQRSSMEHSSVYPQQAGEGEPVHQHPVLEPLVHLQVVPHRPLPHAEGDGGLPAVDRLRPLRLPAQGRCPDHSGANWSDQEISWSLSWLPSINPHLPR